MAERRRVSLSLSLEIPHQREAWKHIRSIPPGQRTDAVCRMICQNKMQEELLEAVRAVIREEMAQAHVVPATEKCIQQPEDVDGGVLGFLLSLQDEGGDASDPLF